MITMKPNIHKLMNETFLFENKDVILEDGMVRYNKPGHTREIAHLGYCHEGRQTSHYYTFGMLLGHLDEQAGLHILGSIARLQRTDPSDPHYGGFRWYQEEEHVNDTNAAFFILRPLVILSICYPDVIPTSHRTVIHEMLRHAGEWFRKECGDPILYYPNKIVSDGALLLAISYLLNNPVYLDAGIRFFERWEDYTTRRGWGWGENISLVYLSVILNALQIAIKVLAGQGHPLEGQLATRIQNIYLFLQFQAGEEFVPTIRSYNFSGETTRDDMIWTLAGLVGVDGLQPEKLTMNHLLSLLVFESEVSDRAGGSPPQPTPRIWAEPIFDKSFAYYWIGASSRLGSISRFPVIAGSYQWPDWGLGWQSFPVSFSVTGEQVSFLRWYVDLGDEVRTHPGESYRTSYLAPALFKESFFPDIQTRSAQSEHCLLTVRSMSNVNHGAAEIADEWVIHRYSGVIEEFTTAAEGRHWLLLRYANTTIAITALNGMTSNTSQRQLIDVDIMHESNRVKLRQVLHYGQAGLVRHARLETGWAVLSLEDLSNKEEIHHYLEGVRIEDRSFADGEVPRTSYTEIRQIQLSIAGLEKVHLHVDPHE
ncbi:hypothetical protein [Paenibacillus oryzisoli]|uniref:Heparin-sulfate lyase N-terminal domain-containing protein n=1 Tax=Paenibacillus oryzisoli TaxID=1850517 RepID=A0A198A5M4_9BACL|nr:hypothetical protein [Paenibacillus oryzisoli]OAS16437.1 hypothetical protein A8708_20745 [Paenibacillus oryzisoli]